jgi:hypothetical protein
LPFYQTTHDGDFGNSPTGMADFCDQRRTGRASGGGSAVREKSRARALEK